MKKTILLAAAIGVCATAMAQDKYVSSAITALNSKDYDEAKADIDKAMADPSTREKPKALFAKVQIYGSLESTEKYKGAHLYREVAPDLIKLAASKPDYEKQAVDGYLLHTASAYFNDGARAYNAKQMDTAAEYLSYTVKIHDMNGGKRFASNKKFDTVAAEAAATRANCYYYATKYELAAPMLTEVKNNPISSAPAVYECLIDAYSKMKKTSEQLATIEEARKKYPDDITIRNYEINYYIKEGKISELVNKLEETAKSEPNNADVQYDLGTLYMSLANPKEGAKPANAAEYMTKAEDAYQRSLKLQPDVASVNYNYGALIFNQASDIIEQMNIISGTSDAEMKKYNALKVKRNEQLNKSEVYLNKAAAEISAKETKSKEDNTIYKSTLTALYQIYNITDQKDKAAETKTKLDALKGK